MHGMRTLMGSGRGLKHGRRVEAGLSERLIYFSAPASVQFGRLSTASQPAEVARVRRGCGVPTQARAGRLGSVEPDDYGGDVVLHGAVAPPALARDLCDPVGGGLRRLGVGRDGDGLRRRDVVPHPVGAKDEHLVRVRATARVGEG